MIGSLRWWLGRSDRRPLRRRRGPRPLMARLLSDGVRTVIVGHCSVCGVAFGARRGKRRQVSHLLVVHEQICPGGDRTGEIAFPLGR